MPQGSLLGPLFFIIYINDLPGIISKDSSIALYADDSKLYRIINSPDDMSSFQSAYQARGSILLRALGVHIPFRNSRVWVNLN